MTRQRERILSDEILGTNLTGTEILRTSIGYSTGGDNDFSGQTEARGYWLYVQPITRTPEGCVRFRVRARALIAPAGRFSAGVLAVTVAPPELIASLRAKVLADEAAHAAQQAERFPPADSVDRGEADAERRLGGGDA